MSVGATTRRRLVVEPGMKFHRLTVLKFSHSYTQPGGTTAKFYLCQCDCGNTTTVRRGNLAGKHPSKSCGCQRQEVLDALKRNGRTHGMTHTRVYKTWAKVVARGQGRFYKSKYYDRGIRVCDRWLNFNNFLEDMGHPPDNKTIDRIDNNGDYCPENCRWATIKEQNLNTRRTKWVIFKGEKLPLASMAEKQGLKPSVVRQRLSRGWSVEKALETPNRTTR